MARYPGGTWRPLPEANREPLITATQVILHTAVSDAASLYHYFARDDVYLESHFYVDHVGQVEQYVDTSRQADANRHANVRAISIETWDGGDPDRTPWNQAQLAALEDLLVWCCRAHGIPARPCPAHDLPGIGWHTMWGAPSAWTPVAKGCPGRPRKVQCPPLIARVAAKLTPRPEEDDPLSALTPAEQRELLAKVRAIFDETAANPDDASDCRLKDTTILVRDLHKRVADTAPPAG